MPNKHSLKVRGRLNKQTCIAVPELSELNEPLWAIIDGKSCLAADLTYHEATEKLLVFPMGTIVTASTAARIPLA